MKKSIPEEILTNLFELNNVEDILSILQRIKSTCSCWEQYKDYYSNELIKDLQAKVSSKNSLDKQDILDMSYLKEQLPQEIYEKYLNSIFIEIENVIVEFQGEKQKRKNKFEESIVKEISTIENLHDLNKEQIKDKFLKEATIKNFENEKVNDFIETAILEKENELISNILKEIEDNLDKGLYITKQDISIIEKKYENLPNISKLKKEIQNTVQKQNKEFIDGEIEKYRDCFVLKGKEEKILDPEQIKAAISDEVSNLVIAGAGCGKTTMLKGKIRYLLKKGVLPEEILLLSYTKKTVTDLNDGLKELNISNTLKAKTFHSLGLEICKNLKECDVINNGFLNSIFNNMLEKNNNKKIKLQNNHINSLKDILFSIKEKIFEFLYKFTLQEDFIEKVNNINEEYVQKYSIEEYERPKYSSFIEQIEKFEKENTSIDGKRYKSVAETKIANFLFLHKIDFEYEKKYTQPYHYDDKSNNIANHNSIKEYHPDFYIKSPKGDLWLEHFGVTIDDKGFMHAKWCDQEEKYIKNVKNKRKTHEINGTILLETNETMHREGVLLIQLEKYLIQHGIDINNKLSDKEISNYIQRLVKMQEFKNFVEYLERYISLYKSQSVYSNLRSVLKTVYSSDIPLYQKQKANAFFEILEPVYNYYTKILKENKSIDFNDMITNAILILESDQCPVKYKKIKYIIVDEYQDITHKRYELLRKLQEISNAHIFCVGDDWQSIYGFNGSDISLFTSFNNFYPNSGDFLYLQTVYRNSQQLLDIASDFIKKNPSQIKKELVSSAKENLKAIQYIDFTQHKLRALKYILDKIAAMDCKATVCLLGRYSWEMLNDKIFNKLSKDDDISYKTGDIVTIKYNKHPELNICFSTIHKAKGLEYDYTILVDLEEFSEGLSFPSNISVNYMLKPLLHETEEYPHAEERRMFYVALTRCKKQCYILSSIENPSSFFNEIEKSCEIIKGTGKKCPKCGHRMIERYNPNTKVKFLGCSQYNTKNCKETLPI